MPSSKDNANRRHEKLIRDYHRLSSIKEHGVPKHSIEWIIKELAHIHCYSKTYTERLIKEKA